MLAVLVAALLAGCAQLTPVAPAPGSPTRADLEGLLAQVRVVPRRPRPGGYDRGCQAAQLCVFGPAWADGVHDCDARNRVLGAQLTAVRFRPGSHDCVVLTGTLADPYTGHRIGFDRARPRAVQIDHIYPLAAAWDLGAANWPLPQRIRFANDVEVNLLAVDGGSNEDKGDRTPADWLPPARAYHCFYAGRYLTTATRYDLPVTTADHATLHTIATHCP
ncbi:hypothetical protein NRB56_56230 [Nocardia sp. RB56]|uniref:GmrSD restriction endonucleases C-terminal domain-containing protein n=1 Tax=Nocardia aurantia TaxID=2585199 RepID=A0A7K0DW82_9NOCA|nr:HNH endonuclease family protein [Nocardia aurantia]MQY30029.1 hypothetical protein [Nocardia aurantia]